MHIINCQLGGRARAELETQQRTKRAMKQGKSEEKETTCPFCSVGCRFSLRVQDGRAVEVVPLRTDEVSRGRLCLRGWSTYGLSLSERPSQPSVEGRPASWEEAVEFASRRLSELVKEYGPESVVILGSSFLPLEDLESLASFAAALGTPNLDDPSRAERALLPANFPLSSPKGLEEADLLLVIGSWLEVRNPILASDIMRSLKLLISLGPVRDRMARLSQVHLQSRPGGESALLAALLKAVGEVSSGKGIPLPSRALEPGVPLEVVEQAARMLWGATRTTIVVSLSLSLLGEVAVAPLAEALADVLGASLVFVPSFSNSTGAEQVCLRPADGGMTAWEALGSSPKRKPRALLCFGDEPLLRLPDVASARKALKETEFVLLAHFCLTESAKIAHAFLPISGPLEVEGTMVNFWGRKAESPSVLSPNGRRPLRALLADLAKAMGISLEGAKWTPGFPSEAPKVEELPIPKPVSPTEERPFVLLLSPLYTWEGEPLALCALPNLEREMTLRGRDFPEGFVSISPEEARKHNLRAWRRVKVASERGEAVLWLHISPEVPEGVALVPFHLREKVEAVFGESEKEPLTGLPVFRPVPVSIGEVT